MSGAVDYFDGTMTTYVDPTEWISTTTFPHVDMTTSVRSAVDVVRDVQTDDSTITVASLVNSKGDDFNLTSLFGDATEHHPSVLIPLTSLWTLFPLVFMTAFLGAWLFRLKYWYYYSCVMVALGLESEIKLTDSSERVPTEVSSARLLRATKSELTLTGIDETGLNTTTPADEFVTVRL